ncbi:putative Prepilin-type N-terminal cleavage/methylation domain-containing protein [Gammaproteobacteria bacterium]
MTLIEVMVGVVLTSILVLALSGTWAMVSDEFFKLTLKQKAIFILNGETERLVAAFRYKDLSTNNWLKRNSNYVNPSTGASINSPWQINPTLRYVYDQDTTDSDLATSDPQNILTTTTTNMSDSQIFVYTANSTYYNIVWLDRERNITATLSWDFSQAVGPNAADCKWGSGPGMVDTDDTTGNHCRVLIVYLRYPFRYQSDEIPIAAVMGPTTEISLQTIVGGIQ